MYEIIYMTGSYFPLILKKKVIMLMFSSLLFPYYINQKLPSWQFLCSDAAQFTGQLLWRNMMCSQSKSCQITTPPKVFHFLNGK